MSRPSWRRAASWSVTRPSATGACASAERLPMRCGTDDRAQETNGISMRCSFGSAAELHYLWRAVDQDGHVLDILVQSRRDAEAAKRFFRKLLRGLAICPTGHRDR